MVVGQARGKVVVGTSRRAQGPALATSKAVVVRPEVVAEVEAVVAVEAVVEVVVAAVEAAGVVDRDSWEPRSRLRDC